MNEIYRNTDNFLPKVNSAYYFVQKIIAPPKKPVSNKIFASLTFSSSSSIRSVNLSQKIQQSTNFQPRQKTKNNSSSSKTEIKNVQNQLENTQNDSISESSDSDDQSVEDLIISQSKQLDIDKNNELQRIINSFNQRINNVRLSQKNFESNDVLLKRVMELERDKWKYIDSIEQQYKQLKEIQIKQIQKLLNDS